MLKSTCLYPLFTSSKFWEREGERERERWREGGRERHWKVFFVEKLKSFFWANYVWEFTWREKMGGGLKFGLFKVTKIFQFFIFFLFGIQTRKSQFYDIAIKRIIFHPPPPSYLCSTQNKNPKLRWKNFFLRDLFLKFCVTIFVAQKLNL